LDYRCASSGQVGLLTISIMELLTIRPGMVVHAYNLKAEGEEWRVGGHPGLHTLGYNSEMLSQKRKLTDYLG
jgi:hypothetical protein